MPTVALGAGLTFMQPLYTPYIHAARVWGMSPEFDQQLGGLIMWIPGSIITIIIASVLFIRWMQEMDARQRAEEARMDALASGEEAINDEEMSGDIEVADIGIANGS
jgi:cytochrome c oxidase assembly factor CtaG